MDLKRLDRLEEILDSAISGNSIAGGSVAVIKNGQTIYRTDRGFADIENGVKMGSDTIFRLFSLSKPITSTAAMILFERGKLDIEYPLKWFIPEFDKPSVSDNGWIVNRERDITIRDLLNMTSGIPYPDQSYHAGKLMDDVFNQVQKDNAEGNFVDTQEYARRAATVPLAFQPGDRWAYGFSADILGAVIEKIADKKYSEFLKDEIFNPLGMVDTDFYVPEEKLSRFAQMYDYNTPDGMPKIFEYIFLGVGNYDKKPAFESGGAGLVSTVSDYGRFATMLANGGTLNGVKILGRKTVDFMSQNQLTDHQKRTYQWDSCKGYGYGNLMRILENPSAFGTNGSAGEFGWDGWAGDYCSIDRKENLVFELFIQKCGGDLNLTRRLRSVVYSAVE
ncbi:MAG: serine hydrolase [Oscillospiraceae bacterium]|nr:serine hydrolase [Oscillospiraceae bacterium]